MGRPSRKRKADGTRITVQQVKPDELTTEIDFDSLSLEDYVSEEKKNEPNGTHAQIKARLPRVVEDYAKERDQFEDLHKSIAACDKVLDSVETYLQGFQADLGTVSAEIETLQNRSTEMNTRLENRKVVEKLLGPAVEDISISPLVVRKIASGPIDESWGRALAELEKKIKGVETRQKDSTTKLQAIEDVLPLLENLRDRAVERIRDHMASQIKALRSPNINAQIIQQNGFLKHKDLYAFLARHQPKLADEFAQAYVNTMRWYYLQHFTRYEAAVRSIKTHNIEKTEALANIEDPTSRRPRGAGPVTCDAYSIGRRLDILKSSGPIATTALSTYLIEEDKSTHYLETPFHTFNLALIDNCTAEYTFLTSFFSAANKNYHAITRSFDAIFAPTFALATALTRSLVENSGDALGILLCVRINQHFAFELQRRKCPVVDGYINGTNMLLWPRFQQIMDAHSESLRKAAASSTSSTRNPLSAVSLLGGGGGANASAALTSAQNTAPHPVTQRFANFLSALVNLSSNDAGTEDVEPVSNSLTRLRTEFEAFLTRLSRSVAGDARKRERFLYNNCSLVCTILEGPKGKLGEEVRDHFEGLREAYSGT